MILERGDSEGRIQGTEYIENIGPIIRPKEEINRTPLFSKNFDAHSSFVYQFTIESLIFKSTLTWIWVVFENNE